MSKFHPAVIIAGSIRTERRVEVRTYVTIQCGVCGHRFERLISAVDEEGPLADLRLSPYESKKTARCPHCNRLCEYEYAVPEAATNVVPLRRAR